MTGPCPPAETERRAFAERHSYASVPLLAEEERRIGDTRSLPSDGFRLLRIPGTYSVYSDWFLAVACSSRS